MTLPFAIIAVVTLAGAIAAMSLRNLVHCALSLVVAFAGLAVFYMQLGAQFLGLAQILVYIGAIAILIVFAILLTRSGDTSRQPLLSSSWLMGLGVALLVFTALGKSILSSSVLKLSNQVEPDLSVRKIGSQLMANFVLPLEAIALLLTVAMIGAVIIAMRDEKPKSK